jgi:polysaccharide export outer membrane protein
LEHEAMLTTKRILRFLTLWLGVLAIGAAAGVAARAAGRVLTTSDVVTIKVVNQPDMDTTTRVETDGTISFPYVGRIKASGLSEDQLAHEIESRLAARQIVTEPHVLVEITSFGTQASVQGQVGTPGVYTLDRPTTLTQLLARAGGVKDVGGPIVVRRAGGAVVKRFESKDVVNGHGPGAQLLVQNNDEIYVDLVPFFYIYGYVNKTGEYPLIRPLTVQQAISIGGGLALLGSEWRIYIKRKAANGETEQVPASLDDQVQPGDTIVVNERIF